MWQSTELKFQITNLLYDNHSSRVICSTADQNLIFYQLANDKELRRAKVLVGDLDQVTDVSVFGAKCEYVVSVNAGASKRAFSDRCCRLAGCRYQFKGH